MGSPRRSSPSKSKARSQVRSGWRGLRIPVRESMRHTLRSRHFLTLHGWIIGILMMLVMAGVARLQLVLGADGSLAIRYLVTLGVGYLVYLLVLQQWSYWFLIRRVHEKWDGSADFSDAFFQGSPGQGSSNTSGMSGGGGDFGGGGASGGFEDAATDALGDVASGTLEAAFSAEEGAIVAVPVVAIFLVMLTAATGAGALLWLYFGSEVLLAVAVELAFSVAGARALMGVERSGWFWAAVKLTWRPLLGALICAVALGAAIDFYLPEADSLRHAVQMWRAN